MRRRRPLFLWAAGAGLIVVAAFTTYGLTRDWEDPNAPAVPSTTTTVPPVETPPPVETSPPVETTPPVDRTPPTSPPPPSVSFSWQRAGAFVWHETDLDPGILGGWLRQSGFGWVVVMLHDGLTEDPIEADWVYRFRLASGLPVGGWGVLRKEPRREAELADRLIGRYGLDFYVANAEVEYEFSGAGGPDPERSARSAAFVRAFRVRRPSPFPAAVSSYCRADQHDIDWASWQGAGFDFLPQAYVNDLGEDAAPAVCATAAAGFFPPVAVHPTIGTHVGQRGSIDVTSYAELLVRAGTSGFSVYLAETEMAEEDWGTLGAAISQRAIAIAT